MPGLPAVNFLAVLVAGCGAFLLGGAYWALLANRLMKALGSPVDTARMPAQALVIAFVTRTAQALAIAMLISYSAAEGILGGAVVGGAACIGFVLPIMAGQAALGPPWGSWPRLLVGAPEVLAGFIVAGAIIGAWNN
ncbi:MAG: DUF1761 family protein [Actinomycetota bacterium]|nr:DUF1761 family protein [Actinomycetota bacterium]